MYERKKSKVVQNGIFNAQKWWPKISYCFVKSPSFLSLLNRLKKSLNFDSLSITWEVSSEVLGSVLWSPLWCPSHSVLSLRWEVSSEVLGSVLWSPLWCPSYSVLLSSEGRDAPCIMVVAAEKSRKCPLSLRWEVRLVSVLYWTLSPKCVMAGTAQ